MKAPIAFALVWLAGVGSYLILAGSFSPDEMAAAVLLGGCGAVLRRGVLGRDARRFAFERPALSEIGGAVAGLPGATLRVAGRLAAALIGGAEGRHVEQPFHRGRIHDPRDAGRRAIVVLATSLAPDSFVLRLPPDEEVIAFHALSGRNPSTDPRWPR